MGLANDIGAIFDWDGVIIDSHAQHEESWEVMARELGRPLPPGFFKATFGMRNDRIIPEFTDWAEPGDCARIAALGERKESVYREIIRRDGIDPLPGVVALLDGLAAAGIPCAVASSTSRENIDTIMAITGLAGRFAAICAEKDVTRGKPDPEVFLKAAAKISRRPDRCVVFEDAHVGVEAGRAAGSKVIAVATTHPAASFAGKADRVVPSLDEVTAADVIALGGAGMRPSIR
jgi:beta-phosphoglucomutase family hydrolase